MRKLGIQICANTLIIMHNGNEIYAEDDIISIERRMEEQQGDEIILTISTALEGISKSVKKSAIKEWREI